MLTIFLPSFLTNCIFWAVKTFVSDRIFAMEFWTCDICILKGTVWVCPWSFFVQIRWKIQTLYRIVLNLLKQLFSVNNNHILFTFPVQIGNVLSGFHGYPWKLLGDSIVRFLSQLLLFCIHLRDGILNRKGVWGRRMSMVGLAREACRVSPSIYGYIG